MNGIGSRALPQERTHQALRIVACAALTTVGAQWALKLPYTPVPITWQVATVLFAGLWLGARGGFAAQALYLSMGLAGAPVFAFGHGGAHYLFNPLGTGGYLLSYPLAAWLVGYLSEREIGGGRSRFVACAAGLAVIYSIGTLWLGAWLHLTPIQALLMGTGSFLLWDVVKAMLVVALLNRGTALRRAH